MDLLTLAFEWKAYAVGAGVVGFLFVCVLLILTVLIQRPQGGGLAGAFGSAAGSGQTAFGAKTGDALTIFTIAMFVVYLLAAVGLNYSAKPSTDVPAAPQASQPASDKSATTEPVSTTPPSGVQIKATNADGTPVEIKPVTPVQPGTEPAATPAPTPGQAPATTPAAPQTPPATPSPAPAGDKPADPKPDQPK